MLKEDKVERVKVETEFKSGRGYKSVHAKIREQVLANKRKHEVVEILEEEAKYEHVEVE